MCICMYVHTHMWCVRPNVPQYRARVPCKTDGLCGRAEPTLPCASDCKTTYTWITWDQNV